MMNSVSQRPIAVQPGSGRELTNLGVTHKLTSDQTGGAYYLCEAVFGPESGSAFHIHHREDEVIYVVEGAIEIRLAHEKLLVPAGGVVHLPKGIPHALYNPLDSNLKIMVHVIPGGLENYFDEMESALQRGPLDRETFLSISKKHGLEWLD
jgi:mannose-6-phosphate isomerase-like protein (cupin superfamily)